MRIIDGALILALSVGQASAQVPQPVPQRGAGSVDPGFGRPERRNPMRPPDPTYRTPGPRHDPTGRGYAGRLVCEAPGRGERRCRANVDARATVVRQYGRARCLAGRTYRAERDAIVVRDGCRGEFAYGYAHAGTGPRHPDHGRRGPSAGAVIAGAAVTGGLLAVLASQDQRRRAAAPGAAASPAAPTYAPRGPATIDADLSALPADARPVAQVCLFETARQVGATGGSRIEWRRLDKLEPGNGGYRIQAMLSATYPDGGRELGIYCRATPQQVVQLDFS